MTFKTGIIIKKGNDISSKLHKNDYSKKDFIKRGNFNK